MVGKLNNDDDNQHQQHQHADADAGKEDEDEDDDDDVNSYNVIDKVVFQDDFRPGHGNALQATVATIFGLQLIDVPNFIDMPDGTGYESAIQQFCCHKQKRRSMIKIKIHDNAGSDKDDGADKMIVTNPILLSNEYDNQLCILRGKSPRGNFGHVVVARKRSVQEEEGVVVNGSNNNKDNSDDNDDSMFEMIHDPHPDGTFLDGNEKFGWCMFFVVD